METKISQSLEKGIKYLSKSQKKDGSFESFTSSEKNNFKKYSSIFPTCLIFSCLEKIYAPKIKERISKFLLSQKSEYWSLNYWKRNSLESKNEPYPDDLDDTFCALSGLYSFNRKLISGKELGKIIMLLTSLEKREGGPYYTWVTPPDANPVWKDIDLAVNSNVAFFLSLQDIYLESINSLVKTATKQKNYSSPYYASQFSVIYFISRFFKEEDKRKIVKFILKNRNKKGHWGNPLDTSLAISSLLNFGFDNLDNIEGAINHIISAQNKNGSWDFFPFTVELIKNGKKYYASSPALSSAFCLEALNKYNSAISKKKAPKKKNILLDNESKRIKNNIIKIIKKRFSVFDIRTKEIFDRTLRSTLKNDKKSQLPLLSYYFRKSLGSKGKVISDKYIEKLGTANVLGWIAYTIYDDFFDNEGNPQKLPIANICLREISKIFTSREISRNDFGSIFENIMDKLDSSNVWETTFCRVVIKDSKFKIPKNLPDYKGHQKLYERSMGHSLGPIAILSSLGFGKNSSEIKNTILFFRHYIIAKQLDDDMHDWEKDLQKGCLSPVVCEIIKVFRKKYKRDCIDIAEDSKRLKEIFWYKIVTDTCSDIIKNARKAKRCLREIKIIENYDLLEMPVKSIETSAQKTIEEQKETIEFLKSMEG